jgi:hypothetical protein
MDLRALRRVAGKNICKKQNKKIKGELKKNLHNGKIHNSFRAVYSTVFLKSKGIKCTWNLDTDEKGVQNFGQKTSRNETRWTPWAWNGGLCCHK